jgi:hypothetical protein
METLLADRLLALILLKYLFESWTAKIELGEFDGQVAYLFQVLYLCKARRAELIRRCNFDCEGKAFGYFTFLGRLDEEVPSFVFLFEQNLLFLLQLSRLGLALLKVLQESIDQSDLLDLWREDMSLF